MHSRSWKATKNYVPPPIFLADEFHLSHQKKSYKRPFLPQNFAYRPGTLVLSLSRKGFAQTADHLLGTAPCGHGCPAAPQPLTGTGWRLPPTGSPTGKHPEPGDEPSQDPNHRPASPDGNPARGHRAPKPDAARPPHGGSPSEERPPSRSNPPPQAPPALPTAPALT